MASPQDLVSHTYQRMMLHRMLDPYKPLPCHLTGRLAAESKCTFQHTHASGWQAGIFAGSEGVSRVPMKVHIGEGQESSDEV